MHNNKFPKPILLAALFALLAGLAIPAAPAAEEASRKKTADVSAEKSDDKKDDAKKDDDKKDRDSAFSAKDDAYFPEFSEKKLSLHLAGGYLEYTASTGITPIFNEEGEETARIFSTSYIRSGGDRERPVTFLFNGGPGSSSIFLHASSFGPKAFPFTGIGVEAAKPPFKLVDNPDSLLDITDLVFIDPVGTGFSYALPPQEGDEDGKDEGKAKAGGKSKADNTAFWGVTQDLECITEFIRVWLDRNERWGAQLFIGGESYGGLRAAGLAASLADIGAAPSGIILISPALSYVGLMYSLENYSPVVLNTPSYAAAAHYFHRLDPSLQSLSVEELTREVEDWCKRRLLPALWQGNAVPPAEVDRLAEEMSRYIGLPAIDCKMMKFRILPQTFSRLLLREKGLTLSMYDARLTAPASAKDSYDFSEDPINLIAGENIKTGFHRFLSENLGLKTLRKYYFMSPYANGKWDFTLGEKGLYGYPSSVESLSKAMRRLPYLKVYLAMGRFDIITPAESAQQGMRDLDIPHERRDNVTSKIYPGGHMMYTNPIAKKELADDLRQWIQDSGE